MCTCRLADAGARVIKIERPEGDFARGYDALVHGESSYFVWLNRGKESRGARSHQGRRQGAARGDARARPTCSCRTSSPARSPSSASPIERLRRDYPRLICCSISGYGESGPYAERKAYDLLIQAEAGLASVTGGPEAPARVGVSVVDIGAGMNAYEAILEALIARGRTGEGAEHLGLDVRRHGGLDDGAAAAARRRQAAEAHRPRAHLDLALRRVQDRATAPTS